MASRATSNDPEYDKKVKSRVDTQLEPREEQVINLDSVKRTKTIIKLGNKKVGSIITEGGNKKAAKLKKLADHYDKKFEETTDELRYLSKYQAEAKCRELSKNGDKVMVKEDGKGFDNEQLFQVVFLSEG